MHGRASRMLNGHPSMLALFLALVLSATHAVLVWGLRFLGPSDAGNQSGEFESPRREARKMGRAPVETLRRNGQTGAQGLYSYRSAKDRPLGTGSPDFVICPKGNAKQRSVSLIQQRSLDAGKDIMPTYAPSNPTRTASSLSAYTEVDPSVKTAPHRKQDIKILLLKIQTTRRG